MTLVSNVGKKLFTLVYSSPCSLSDFLRNVNQCVLWECRR